MANNVAAFIKVDYELRTQAKIMEDFIGKDLANFELEGSMHGKTIDYTRVNFQPIQSYTRYTNLTDVDITGLNEQLVIDTSIATSFVVDVLDEADAQIPFTDEVVNDNAFKLRRKMELDFLKEGLNALNADTAATTLSNTNAVETYSDKMAELAVTGVNITDLALVVSPRQYAKIGQNAVDNTFALADRTFTNNYKGDFLGAKLFVTRNLPATVILDLATTPTANDTVTINGVVFKFVVAASVAGDVELGASADAAAINLVAAINAPLTTTATYTAIGQADANRIDGFSAVDGTDALTITMAGDVKVSSDLTAAADDFQAVIIHNFLMNRGSIHMARKIAVKLITEKVQSQFATRYSTLAYYGLKTFVSGAEKMYDILISSIAAEA